MYEIMTINIHLVFDVFSCRFIVYFLASHLQIVHSNVSFFLSLIFFHSILSHLALFLLCVAPCVSFYLLNILYIAYIHFVSV